MKLFFKQRLFSWFDSYDIYDANGDVVYIVKGQLSWGHRLNIYNPSGEHIGTIKEEKLTLVPRLTLYIADRFVGEINKELSLVKPKFHLDCNDWSIEGDCQEWDIVVKDSSGVEVMHTKRQALALEDSFEINVSNPEDSIYALLVVLAIDIAKCCE